MKKEKSKMVACLDRTTSDSRIKRYELGEGILLEKDDVPNIENSKQTATIPIPQSPDSVTRSVNFAQERHLLEGMTISRRPNRNFPIHDEDACLSDIEAARRAQEESGGGSYEDLRRELGLE